MVEIAIQDRDEVRDFLLNQFKVPSDEAVRYADIAVHLSDEGSFDKALARVDRWLDLIHAEALEAGVFQDPPGSEAYHAPGKGYNTTSRLLHAAANSLGWSTGGNLVLSGFTHPPDFERLVKLKLLWKDMVASGHGEFTHTIQWMTIYTVVAQEAPHLYSKTCDYVCKDEAFGNGRRTYLWDFLVDCFPTPPLSDWRKEARSSTPRSPTIANKRIFDKAPFFGALLAQRYSRKKYVQPSDGKGQYTSTSKWSHYKHLLDKESAPSGVEPSVREDRKMFEGQRGYKGLVTTGHKPKSLDPVNKTGFIFARSDQMLKSDSALMVIAMNHKL